MWSRWPLMTDQTEPPWERPGRSGRRCWVARGGSGCAAGAELAQQLLVLARGGCWGGQMYRSDLYLWPKTFP